jgi:ubiquinone/menaquinone biosynthesis C-methylase UbiE
MPTPSITRVKEVFEQWAMYDAVVRHDYMRHKEIVAALAERVAELNQPLRIIDLGCGDAGLATSAFRNANVAHYRGVDLSESAVERARDFLACWPGRAEAVSGNLVEFVATVPDQSANVVLASYSLHHFASAQKIALINHCYRILSPGGIFFWIDAVRSENDTRDAYLARLTTAMQRDWIGLSQEYRARGIAHVLESDFPETARWMQEQVARAGFQPGEPLLTDEFFAGWTYVKR